MRERPADEADAQPAVVRIVQSGLAARPPCAAPRAGIRSAPAPARTCSRAARRARPVGGDAIAGRRRTPLVCGRRPVATVVQIGSAWVGRSVARCVATPVSSSRPKLGSRPSATASEMWSSEAPSTASSTTRPPGTSPTQRRPPAAPATLGRRNRPGHAASAARPPTTPSSSPAARRSAPCRGGRCAPARPRSRRRRRWPRRSRPASCAVAVSAREERREVGGVQPQHGGAGAGRDRAHPGEHPHAEPAGRQHLAPRRPGAGRRARRRPGGRCRRRPGRKRRPADRQPTASGNAGFRCSVAIER